MAEGLVARLGRRCFRRRWWVLAIWLLAVGGGVLSVGPVFHGLAGGGGPSSLESVQANQMLADAGRKGATVTAVVDGIDPTAAAVHAAVLAAAADIGPMSGVAKVTTPYDPDLPPARAAAQVARDHRAVLVNVELAKLDKVTRHDVAAAVSARLHQLGGTLAGAQVRVGGGAALSQQANDAVQRDLSRAEELSLPITLVILVFVFGGLIAAGLPVLAAVVSAASVMTVLLLFAQFTDLDNNAVTVVSLLALGLSIDYGLLLVGRYREELGGGHEPDVAIARAWATAGRTILFSALTVAAAMSGLLLFGITGLSALGAAGVSIALVAMLVSLTLTAALIGLARRRIKPSRRAARRIARYGDAAEVGFFARLARIVQRRPLITVLATGAALIGAGAPLLSTGMHLDDVNSLPRSMEAVAVAHDLADRFNVATAPAVVVVARTDAASLDSWAARWTGTAGVSRVAPAEQVGPGLAVVDIDMAGDPESATARALVDKVRADRPAGQSWVTGDAATLNDLLGLLEARLPWAAGVTVLAMVVLLFAMTGSLVVPVKAVVMNAISLGATFGVMSAVFGHGFLARQLGLITVAGLNPFVVVIVFAFAFGLSMDYEVFLLNRIKEYVDRGLETDHAVRRGLQNSGRIITSAALLMVVVFAAFGMAKTGTIQQVGLGLAVAVAVDATIVRCVLVPATMTLLGRFNWWAPVSLGRLHQRFALRETRPGEVAGGTPAAEPAEPAEARPEPVLS
ncbi:MAG: MMPL family transporter [Actinobacteria bacterium]|nr:MAG: MMPL family transporter [Actinomycetota bacterium]